MMSSKKGAQVAKEIKADEEQKIKVAQANGTKKLSAEEQLDKMKAEGKKVFKEPKEPKNPNFERNHFDEGLAFVERCKSELGCEVKMVDVDNKSIPKEPVIMYKGRRVAQIAPRAQSLYGYYTDKPGRVHNEDEENELFEIIKNRCVELDKVPEAKPKVKASKKAPAKSFEDYVESMEKRIADLSPKSNAIKLPKGLSPVNKELQAWAEEKSYEIVPDQAIVKVHK